MNSSLDSFYTSANSKKYYALYAPAIAKFLLVDEYNLFCLFRTAQIVSSKINTVVIILSEKEKPAVMNNENSLKFTLHHSKFQAEISGKDLRQAPTIIFLNDHLKIIKKPLGEEFENKDRKEKLLELQTYAQFVNLCMHSIMLISVINQQAHIKNEQEEYESFYFNKEQKPSLITEIMNILLFANSIEEAKQQLEQWWIKKLKINTEQRVFWPEKIKEEIITHCTMFYEITKINVPTGIQNILNNDKS